MTLKMKMKSDVLSFNDFTNLLYRIGYLTVGAVSSDKYFPLINNTHISMPNIIIVIDETKPSGYHINVVQTQPLILEHFDDFNSAWAYIHKIGGENDLWLHDTLMV